MSRSWDSAGSLRGPSDLFKVSLTTGSSTALSHDIHEQILTHHRSLFLVGHTPGSGIIQDDEVRSAFLAPVSDTSVLRKEETAMSSFTPIFATLTEEDVAHLERERDKDSKRKKRATRARRGVALPDREPQKTHRTLINPIAPNGFTSAPVETNTAPVTTNRRAAAIAAQANINLLAQDLPIPLPPSPIPQPSTYRARKPGRAGRGTSRTSPTPGREGSVVNGDTSMMGLKRSLREDSISETASPMPLKRRTNGRITSPDNDELLDSGRTIEVDDGRMGIKSDTSASNGDAGWHCRNCGVPEHLSGGIRKDPAGRRILCGTCGMFPAFSGCPS